MIIRNISIRLKLFLTTLILVMLLTLLALIYLDATRRMESQSEFLKVRTELNSGFLAIQNSFYALSAEERSDELSDLLQQKGQLEEDIRRVLVHEISFREEGVNRKAEQILTLLARFEESLRIRSISDQGPGLQARTDMELLGAYMEDLNQALTEASNRTHKQRNWQLGIAMALGIFILANVLILFTVNIGKSFRNLSRYTRELGKGSLPESLDPDQGDEFGEIARHLNLHTGDLQKKIDLLSSMSQDGPGELFTPEAEDKLGNALLVLSDFLTRKELQEVSRNREDKKVNWISEGAAQLGEVLRSERDDVGELTFLIIQKLVSYMNMEMGSLFVANGQCPAGSVRFPYPERTPGSKPEP